MKYLLLLLALALPAHAEFGLVNVSIRGHVGTGDNVVILGFIVPDCYQTLAVAIVGRGPSLQPFGVTNYLPDPYLTVVDQATGQVLDKVDSWQEPDRIDAVTFRGFAQSDPREAVSILVLKPGAYTAILSGNGSTGVGIVELYGGL